VSGPCLSACCEWCLCLLVAVWVVDRDEVLNSLVRARPRVLGSDPVWVWLLMAPFRRQRRLSRCRKLEAELSRLREDHQREGSAVVLCWKGPAPGSGWEGWFERLPRLHNAAVEVVGNDGASQ